MTELNGFLMKLGEYSKRARERHEQYLNSPYSDASFEVRTLYEMCIDLSNRLKKIEEVMNPAPEHVKDEEADALEGKKTKFW